MGSWRTGLLVLALLVAAACAQKEAGAPAEAPEFRHPKKQFAPPAGAFTLRRMGEGGSAGPAQDEKAEEPALAASDVRVEPAPDLGARVATGALPAGLLARGSAREADVRAERLHRLLAKEGALPKGARVREALVTAGGLLRLALDVDGPAEPSLATLSALAQAATGAAREALPEAEPAAYLEIEIHTRVGLRATWRGGGWQFPQPG